MFNFLWELNACIFWHLIAVALLPWHFISWFKVKRNLKLRLDKIFKDKAVEEARFIIKQDGQIHFMSCNEVSPYFSTEPSLPSTKFTVYNKSSERKDLFKSGLVEMNLTLNEMKDIQRDLIAWSEEWIPFVYTTIEIKYTKDGVKLSCSFFKFLHHSPYRLKSAVEVRLARRIIKYFKKEKAHEY